MKGTKPIWAIVTFVLFLALAITAPATDTQKPLKVFILIGTSNMMGFGANIGQLPADLKQPQKDVLVYQENAWVPLKLGEWKQAGPEHSFAQAMTKYLGEPVGIIKVVKPFNKGEKKPSNETLAILWSPDDPQSRYAQLVQLVKEIQKQRPIVVTGICWDQSGRDTVKEETAKAYSKNMTHLIESMRRDFGDPALPFVCALDNTHPGKPDGFPYMDMVREAQISMKVPAFRTFDQNDLPRVMDTAKEDYEKHNDHFTTAGEVESGKRYAAAMMELLNHAKGLPAAKSATKIPSVK